MKKIIISIFACFFLLSCGTAQYQNSNSVSQESEKPMKVGVLLPLTGDFAALGKSIRNGMELARADIAEQHNGRAPSVMYENACLAQETTVAIQKLLSLDQVDTIGGSFCLIGLVPILTTTEEKKVIVFNTAANPDLVLNKRYVFSTNISIRNDAEKMVDYAVDKLKAKKAAIVYLATPFGQDYQKYLSQSFEKSGGSVVFSEAKLLDASDFRTEVAKIKEANPDVIFVVHLAKSLGIFLKQAKEQSLESKILGHYEAEDPTVIDIAKAAAEGFIISSSDPESINRDFEESYKAKFGQEADVLARNAYDALMLQYSVYNECDANSDCMQEKLHTIKDYDGVSGKITFEPDGSANKPTIFKVVSQGKFVVLP